MTQIYEIHPRESERKYMPYAPAVRVDGNCSLLFISGATSSPLYHQHPHVPEEHIQPDDIREQTRRVLENIKIVLDAQNLTWRHIVRVTRYLTDMREMDAVNEVMREYFGDWKPASTTVCINNLSSPGARIEIEATAIIPLDAQ